LASSLGLFGGSFDPVHFGHLRLAAELREALSLGRVAFLPTGRPWQRGRDTHASGAHRAAMLRLATAGDGGFVVDERELAREGDTYTIDTLEAVRREVGAACPLVFLCGSDTFAKIDTWHRWESIFDYAHFAVAVRADDAHWQARGMAAIPPVLRPRVTAERGDLSSAPAGRIIALPMTPLAISSTAIRDLAAAGSTIRYLTPDPVVGYIQQHSLYGSPA
jgi:nicotinate-nucleotide adenylyltransferase